MKKYFLALYDIEDNNIMDFNSIKECAKYFNTTCYHISDWLHKKYIKDKKYKLFKFNSPQI